MHPNEEEIDDDLLPFLLLFPIIQYCCGFIPPPSPLLLAIFSVSFSCWENTEVENRHWFVDGTSWRRKKTKKKKKKETRLNSTHWMWMDGWNGHGTTQTTTATAANEWNHECNDGNSIREDGDDHPYIAIMEKRRWRRRRRSWMNEWMWNLQEKSRWIEHIRWSDDDEDEAKMDKNEWTPKWGEVNNQEWVGQFAIGKSFPTTIYVLINGETVQSWRIVERIQLAQFQWLATMRCEGERRIDGEGATAGKKPIFCIKPKKTKKKAAAGKQAACQLNWQTNGNGQTNWCKRMGGMKKWRAATSSNDDFECWGDATCRIYIYEGMAMDGERNGLEADAWKMRQLRRPINLLGKHATAQSNNSKTTVPASQPNK